MLFAAIDIGSNAVRLLFSEVLDPDAKVLRKIALIRIPLRLGIDSFSQHKISPEKEEDLINTMKGFKSLITVMKPLALMACATSAMREAQNGSAVVQRVQQEAGIPLEIIGGEREAEIIFCNHFEVFNTRKSYLYIDVGGGSTELTLFAQGTRIASRSFNIGTIRLLQNTVQIEEWTKIRSWLEAIGDKYHPLVGIGSGGNINTLFKMTSKREGKALTFKDIEENYEKIKSFSYEERIYKLGLKPDRADVIVPALEVFTAVMKWSKITKLQVPMIGLIDGMIHILHEQHQKRNTTPLDLALSQP